MAVVIAIASVILVEVMGFLVYKIFNIEKNLRETTSNLNGLAECVLKLAKATQNVDVIETSEDNATDFNFPNKEGF